MNDLVCPYCAKIVEIDYSGGFGWDEDVKWQQECPGCEKTFYFTSHISISHNAFAAPCIDSGEHSWGLSTVYPRRFTTWRCSCCDEEKAATKEEIMAVYPNAFNDDKE